jgi:uncharacterized membrane protein
MGGCLNREPSAQVWNCSTAVELQQISRSLEVAIRVWEMSLVPSKKGFSVRVEVVPFLALLSALSGLLVRQAFDSAS